MNIELDVFKTAYETRDIHLFMNLLFPENWSPIIARIMESGVTFSETDCHWQPKWSKISPTKKKGNSELEKYVKSCIYRAHDCIHQLWGVPIPKDINNNEEFYSYKRAQICGEVAVLTIIEFILCKHFYDKFPATREILYKRNAIPLLYTVFKNKSTLDIALRLDGILHKKINPKWVRDNSHATAFVEDYVPMLEFDRKTIDHNWNLMKKNGWLPPSDSPNVRYSDEYDGLELTAWMINDFYHLLGTSSEIDTGLCSFNRERREKIILPDGWNGYVEEIRSCGTCHYSTNGKHGCNRLMDHVLPKIDISKGVECAYNKYTHYLKFKENE